MVINESLAKGLKDRFFAEFQEDISAYVKGVSRVRTAFSKKNKWLKAVRADLSQLHRFSLGCYEGGSQPMGLVSQRLR